MSTKEFGPDIRCSCQSDTFVMAHERDIGGLLTAVLRCVVCGSPVYVNGKLIGAISLGKRL